MPRDGRDREFSDFKKQHTHTHTQRERLVALKMQLSPASTGSASKGSTDHYFKNPPVVNMYNFFLVTIPLNNAVEQFTLHLHCVRYPKQSGAGWKVVMKMLCPVA
jgi:hypothetical protein